jgi:hypothetical protein
VRRWGRAHLPALDIDVLPAFTPVRLAAALVALPLADRLGDGFHRRFLARQRPDLALPEPARPEEPNRSQAALARVVRSLRRRRAREQPLDELTVDYLRDRPRSSAFLRETIEWPALTETFGAGWVDRLRAGVEAGAPQALATAMLMCGPRALEQAREGLGPPP